MVEAPITMEGYKASRFYRTKSCLQDRRFKEAQMPITFSRTAMSKVLPEVSTGPMATLP